MIYLDNAATTLIKPVSVAQAMLNAMRSCASPGRGGHRAAMRASELVYRCREQAAELFDVPDPARVVFTMNATHGLNIAIRSLAKAGAPVLISGYEHNAVTRPLHQLGAKLLIAESPLFDREACLRAFEERIGRAELVVCTMVSNVFGFILPVYDIAALCADRGVPLIVDASQAAGILDVDFRKLGAAFVAMPGHKGLLQEMPAYLPDRLEAGTHNVPGIAGLLAGIEYIRSRGPDSIMEHERGLLRTAVSQLRDCGGLELFTGKEETQSGVLSFRYDGMDCDEAARQLSERGICLRSGLHCAPLAHMSAGTVDTGTLRMSFSPFVSAQELNGCCKIIKEMLI